MRKAVLMLLVSCVVFTVYGKADKDMKRLEDSITKDYDQDGVYSSYEKALRRAQESVYVSLPEKRGYWYTMLDRIKAEEEELMPDEQARIRRKR